MFSSDKNIETIGQLVEVIRHYVGLQNEYLRLDVIEKVVRLITALAIAAVTFLFDAKVLHSNLPMLDCAIFSLQAVATFLMVRKDINAWICYLICDAIYIPLGIMGGSYKWLFISACFLITATYGFIVFIKAWRATRKVDDNA